MYVPFLFQDVSCAVKNQSSYENLTACSYLPVVMYFAF